MNLGKIVAGRDGWTGGRDGEIEGSTRGPRGPKNGAERHLLLFSAKMNLRILKF